MAEKIVNVEVRMKMVGGDVTARDERGLVWTDSMWTTAMHAAAESLRREGEASNCPVAADERDWERGDGYRYVDRSGLTCTFSSPTLTGFTLTNEQGDSYDVEFDSPWMVRDDHMREAAETWHAKNYELLPDECREPGKPPRKLAENEVQGVNGEPCKLEMHHGECVATTSPAHVWLLLARDEDRFPDSPFRSPAQYARGLAFWSQSAPPHLCIDSNGTREMLANECRDLVTGKALKMRIKRDMGGEQYVCVTEHWNWYPHHVGHTPREAAHPCSSEGQRLRVEGFLANKDLAAGTGLASQDAAAVLTEAHSVRLSIPQARELALQVSREADEALAKDRAEAHSGRPSGASQQEAIRALISECWTEAVTLRLPSHGVIPNITENPEYAPVLASVFSGFVVARMAGYGGSGPGLFPEPFDCAGTGRTKEESDAQGTLENEAGEPQAAAPSVHAEPTASEAERAQLEAQYLAPDHANGPASPGVGGPSDGDRPASGAALVVPVERPPGIPASATIWTEVVDGHSAWFVPAQGKWCQAHVKVLQGGQLRIWSPENSDKYWGPSAAAQCRQLYERGCAEQEKARLIEVSSGNLPPIEVPDVFGMLSERLGYTKPRPACLPASIPDTDFTVIDGRTVWRESDMLCIDDGLSGPWRAWKADVHADRGPYFRESVPESLFRKAREWMGWEKAEASSPKQKAYVPIGDQECESRACIEWGNESCHDGAGWYFWDEEYPEEGSHGAYATREEAENHARSQGYCFDEEDDAPSPADGPAPVFGREWEMVGGGGHDRPEWRLGFGPLLVVAFGPSAEDVELDWQDKPRPETEDGLFAIAMELLAAMPPAQVVAAMSEEMRERLGRLLCAHLDSDLVRTRLRAEFAEGNMRTAHHERNEALARAENAEEGERAVQAAHIETLARAEKAEADFANAADVGRRLEATLKRIPEPDHWAAKNPGRADRLERCAMLAGKELGVDHEEAAPVEFVGAIQTLKAFAPERKQVDLGELREVMATWTAAPGQLTPLIAAVEKLLSEGGEA